MLVRTKHPLHPGTLFKMLMFFLLVISLFMSVLQLLPVQTDPPLISFITSFCFGSVLLITFCMIVADICSFLYQKLLCRMTHRGSVSDKTEIKIRALFSLMGAMILIAAGSAYANNLTVEHVTVPIKGLRSQFSGTTIVQISDIHLGPANGRSRLVGIVQKVNSLRADIVVITGDLVDSSVHYLEDAVQPLKDLQTKHGSYYITGNYMYVHEDHTIYHD